MCRNTCHRYNNLRILLSCTDNRTSGIEIFLCGFGLGENELMNSIKAIDSIIDRFPTRQDSFLVFSVCIFPIHFWISIAFLYNFPSLILKANIWQMLGVLAYMFTFALIESISLFLFIVLISVLLPTRLIGKRFVSLGTIMAIAFSVTALLLNNQLAMEKIWLLLTFLGILLATLIFVNTRATSFKQMDRIAERFSVIALLFIIVDIASVFYITMRQII